MKKLLIALILLFQFLGWISCSKKTSQFIPGTLSDGKYDSEFPSRSSSEILEKISYTIRMINSVAYYEGYAFAKSKNITRKDILNGAYESKSDSVISFHNSSSGTATIIYQQSRRIAILTSAHVVEHPDTLITYFFSDETDSPRTIESFSLKKKQRNTLVGIPHGSGFEVLAIDPDLDLTVLGKVFTNPPVEKIPVFDLPIGSAKELQWGSFVYLIGWPKGQEMVTRGIVSNPDRDKQHSFLIDALFNRGFSGGLVLAIRDGVPNLELVGIVGSVSASFEQVLTPESKNDISVNGPRLPYTDNVYILSRQQIDYGITHAIPVEAILGFLDENKSSFENNGYDFKGFFHQ